MHALDSAYGHLWFGYEWVAVAGSVSWPVGLLFSLALLPSPTHSCACRDSLWAVADVLLSCPSLDTSTVGFRGMCAADWADMNGEGRVAGLLRHSSVWASMPSAAPAPPPPSIAALAALALMPAGRAAAGVGKRGPPSPPPRAPSATLHGAIELGQCCCWMSSNERAPFVCECVCAYAVLVVVLLWW